MTEETLPKGQTQEGKVENVEGETQQKVISVEEILNSYPIDRDRCRDVVLLQISNSLGKISQSLEAISQGLIVANTHLAESNVKRGPIGPR